uniref:beta strand repeat-containing protein n=1 Tax=Synechococcus sp. UW140 TaxID=368503 RepID=UPI003137BC73
MVRAASLPFLEDLGFMGTAPAIAWTKLFGGASEDVAYSVSTASDGSIYITGRTYGSIDGQSNSGGTDAFITKFNSDGSKVWTKLLGGGSNDIAKSVSTASDGSIYIAGYTDGSGAFIAKFNSDGSNVWTKLLGGGSYDYAHSVSTASDGSVYIAGKTDISFDGQTYSGNSDAFITKFNSDGSKVWTRLVGGASSDSAYSVSTASDGSIYITGSTDGIIDGQSNNGSYDAFITKFNRDGSKVWTKLLGGGLNESAYSVSAATDGSIYITGDTPGNIDGQSNNGSYGAFITKYNSDGSKVWTKLLGGGSGNYAYSVSTASDGSIYIAGYTYGSIDGQSNSGGTDAFITKFNSDGSKVWTKLLGGGSYDKAYSARTDNDGSIYISGYTEGSIDGQSNNGWQDAFIIKLNSDGDSGNPKTYTLTPSTSSINEGGVLTSTIATTNVATGTKFYYALSGTGITTADFSAGALTGEGITDATGKFSFSHTVANDLTTEGVESLSIKLYSDSARTLQVGSTATVSIVDSSTTPAPTYTLAPSATTINEGAVLTSSVTTTNVATGTKLYYALSGTGITTADFAAGALTGEGVTDATGKFTFTHTLANDLTTEGAESLSIKLYSDAARTLQVGSAATVSVVDSSNNLQKIDLSKGETDLLLNTKITDASGFNSSYLSFSLVNPPSGVSAINPSTNINIYNDKISGSIKDGNYSSTVKVGGSALPGTYAISSLQIEDSIGNRVH